MMKILEKCKTDLQDILGLCKKPEKLKFVELSRDMFKGDFEILNKYFKNEQGQDCYYANLLYFKNLGLDLKDIKAELKQDFKQDISLAGYKYNPEHYRFKDWLVQEEYEEDLFKNQENIEKTSYIEQLDIDALNSLYKILFKALKQRYIILFGLESIPAILNNAIDCYNLGVSCKPSNLAMRAKLKELKTLLENPEVIAWLKTGASDMSFDKSDYVETYQRVLRQVSRIKDNLKEYQDLIHNDYDLFENEILENNYLELENYIENDSDDEDDSDYID